MGRGGRGVARTDGRQRRAAGRAARRNAASGGGEFVRFVPLREFGQGRLAALAEKAPPALEAYRQRVDPLAEAWLKQAVAERDPRRLQEIVDRFFASRSGDDALFRLGEIELEQGNFREHADAWEQLSPPLTEPAGPPAWLAYPDTDLDLEAVRARLALVSILEGSPARAQRELAAVAPVWRRTLKERWAADRGGTSNS